MIIKDAKFLISNENPEKCPPQNKPEYAFTGRSNVGKSTLINMLCNRKNLAKTSSTPGKTRLINHFLINNSWYLVDLPGYGYARVSKKEKGKFEKLTPGYINNRKNLMCIFVLIDVRLKPQKSDLTYMEELGEAEVPFAMIFTKSDKPGKNKTVQNVEIYKKEMLKKWEELPPMFISSSITKEGREEILEFIDNINKKW
ncbi:ribosome biogenesis GTP-binding protein YihA/YsxC [Marinilabiliaceae bacterium ANBcel2]|nr:ribosome biogenesis GTP-binding protein YihA/YsxC [Marinilabiliaceae bacterium ANBcel2]